MINLSDHVDELPEDFEVIFLKQRGKILTRISNNLDVDSSDEIRFHAYLTQSYLGRFGPALESDFYFDMITDLFDTIPLEQTERYAYFFEPLGEAFKTFIFRNIEDAKKPILFWKLINDLIRLMRESLQLFIDPYYHQM